MKYTVQIDEPSSIVRKLKITIPAETVGNHYESGLASIQKQAKLKGFRPGKVPVPVVEKYYGDELKHRVFHSLVDESFDLAVREHQLRPVNRPSIETAENKSHAIELGQDLIFTATVEIMPDIELKAYTGLSAKKEKVEIKDEDIEALVKQVIESHAEIIPLPEDQVGRAAVKGDFVDIHFEGGVVTDTGVEKRKDMEGNRVVEIGSASLVDGFEDQLIGMKATETKTFTVRFSKDYGEETLREKEAQFTVTLNEIKLKRLPELSDEFAKEAGYDDVPDMRAKARIAIERSRNEDARHKLENDMVQTLIDKNKFDVPQSMVTAQTQVLARDFAEDLTRQGFKEDLLREILVKEQDNLRKRAERQVRAGLLLNTIARKENIEVSETDIDTEMTKMSERMGLRKEDIKKFYDENRDKKDGLIFRLREQKAIQLVVEKASIK